MTREFVIAGEALLVLAIKEAQSSGHEAVFLMNLWKELACCEADGRNALRKKKTPEVRFLRECILPKILKMTQKERLRKAILLGFAKRVLDAYATLEVGRYSLPRDTLNLAPLGSGLVSEAISRL